MHIFMATWWETICGLTIFMEMTGLFALNAPVLEYCGGDTFSPSCQEEEILLIHQAVYGRMRIGRCVTIDLGYLGCTSDVLGWMDKRCSGKQTCEVRVMNHELKENLQCLPVDFTPYLEVSSSCVPVIPANTQCSSPYHISASKQTQVLSSDITLNSGCGSEAAPWVIQAKKGQQINVSLVDIYWQNQHQTKDSCPAEYGYIVDGETSDMSTICGGSDRQKHLLVSSGDVIHIVFKQEVVEEYRFLIEFSVVGCEDIRPPRGAWTKRHKDILTIGCYNDRNQWTVTCNGSQWLGHYGSCDRDQKVRILEQMDQATDTGISRVVVLSLIGGITAVLCCVAITTILTFFCIRKQKQLMKSEEYCLQTLPLNKQGTLHQFRTIQSNYRPTSMSHQRTGSQSDWTSLRLPQNTNLMMTSLTSSMGGGDTVYDVVPNTDDIQRNTGLM